MNTRNHLFLVLLFGICVGIVVGFEVIHLAAERTCPQPVCLGRDSVVPVSDRGFFSVVHELFSNAKESIYVIAYELKYYPKYPNSSVNVLVEDLVRAHERGVDVRVIVDDHCRENSGIDFLVRRGVDVRYDNVNVTTHAKLIVVDKRFVVIGSTNLSHYGLERNNEVNLLVESERVSAYFLMYFIQLWGV